MNNQQIGGLNKDLTAKEVEIDETKYFHKKYHRGRYRDGQWVFGGVARESGNCFFVAVPSFYNKAFLGFIKIFLFTALKYKIIEV